MNIKNSNLTPQQFQQYLLRSYTAVDGLWFMKAEEALGFEAALDMDAKVWTVMPKIQARQLKAIAGADKGLSALGKCLLAKLQIDGFSFSTETLVNSFEVRISHCPWHDKTLRANRAHLSSRIGNRICTIEYSVWASEFGCTFRFADEKKICDGQSTCILKFSGGKEQPQTSKALDSETSNHSQ